MDNTDPGCSGPHTCSPTLGGRIESTPVLPTHTKLCTHGPQNHRQTVAVGFFPSFLRFQTSRIFCSLRPLSAFPRSESSLLPSPHPHPPERQPGPRHQLTQFPNKSSTVSRSQNSKPVPDPWVRTSANGTKSRNPLLPAPSDPARAAEPPPSHLRLSTGCPHTWFLPGHPTPQSTGPSICKLGWPCPLPTP